MTSLPFLSSVLNNNIPPESVPSDLPSASAFPSRSALLAAIHHTDETIRALDVLATVEAADVGAADGDIFSQRDIFT
jgi:hypothetical protein